MDHCKRVAAPAASAMLRILVGCSVLAACSQSPPQITHGVASGDVSSDSAVVWSRADSTAAMHVRFRPADPDGVPREVASEEGNPESLAAQVRLTGLDPGTRYLYEVWFENGRGRSAIEPGEFRTAPARDSPAQIRFLWSGDLGGQGYCRRDPEGYAIFRPMRSFEADFFVANGDMIYADNDCPRTGPVEGWVNLPGSFPGIGSEGIEWEDRDRVEEVYAAHWSYNREDPAFQEFLAGTSVYSQWDDHEVINDFGARWRQYPPEGAREGFASIVDAGRRTFFDFHPILRQSEDPDRIYRSFRWGRGLELFILDARSYRSENRLADTPENSKTMLGAEQLEWLEAGLARSDATWKIVSSDVPLSSPTGSTRFGRDAFANGETTTGFETELLSLVEWMDASDIANVVFIATDVHFPAQLRYEIDADGDGDLLRFHELISGPLSAVRNSPPEFDPTLQPAVLYAEGNLFNFGTVRIGDGSPGAPLLWTDIRDEEGEIRPGSELVLTPEE